MHQTGSHEASELTSGGALKLSPHAPAAQTDDDSSDLRSVSDYEISDTYTPGLQAIDQPYNQDTSLCHDHAGDPYADQSGDDCFSVVSVSNAGSDVHFSDDDFETFEPLEIVEARLTVTHQPTHPGSAPLLLSGADLGASPSKMSAAQEDWQQAGHSASPQDLAGPGAHGQLNTTVTSPQTENKGTTTAYISYLVTTHTTFKSFAEPESSVRRRYTDFVFLYNTLCREYPQCAVPPLPEKHNYVRGDYRFSQEFTSRRMHSLGRFLRRLELHPVLRRSTILVLFLESRDWNATMRSRPMRSGSGGSESGSAGGGNVLESWTDGFLNAFSKVHKTDKRFQDVSDHAKKLDDDLGVVSKTVARVAKREADLSGDYSDLAQQFTKLAGLEAGVQNDLSAFSHGVQATSEGWKTLHDHTDQNYLTSLKDMESYITSVKSLLKTREQKQLDFEGLTDYLSKAHSERDTLANNHHSGIGASGFLRQKLEDVRGVDHEQARRERVRKLELSIGRLTEEVERARKTTEAFDEEVIKEVADFERIKSVEMRDTLGGLADAHIAFFGQNIKIWEDFVKEQERLQALEGDREAATAGA